MFSRWLCLLCFSALLVDAADAPPPVTYLPSSKTWILRTQNTAYALAVNSRGELQNLYWGKSVWRNEDFPEPQAKLQGASFDPAETQINDEFPGWGGTRYQEPSVKVSRTNGVRDLVLHYASHKVDGSDLTITLKDINDEIYLHLHYHAYPEADIIRKSAVLENKTKEALDVESLQSGVWYVPRGDGYRVSYLTGRWAGETQLVREQVNSGTKVIESRKGHTSHNFNPWFALDEGQADEESGRVWFGALAWSGNWRLAVEQSVYGQVRVTGGWNTFDFGYRVNAGETLEAPAFYGGYADQGFGQASRLLHRFELNDILPHGEKAPLRPVLYNSWEATTFAVDEAGQKALADKAAKLGVELFVMDDGWFGKRNNDKAGLGDWTVNPQKFPNGLKSLIDYVESLGMKFGLWVEPEMVNPDSDLYRAHPDWAMHFPGRPQSTLRNQLVLNFARDDVREYIFQVLDKLATENNISYFKWDMNRPFAEPGWEGAPDGVQKELWVKYVRNLYNVIDRLREKHPGLAIESCSGGGGRVDLGILKRVDEVWPSDNTEAFDRLRIQEGFTQAYTPKIMSAWVTDVPNMNKRSVPLKFRFIVSMQGALGIGANLNHWTNEDNALAKSMVEYYKKVRPLVQQGSLYRLLSPRLDEVTANEYVSQDRSKAVLFATLHSQQYRNPMPFVRLRGLDEKTIYRVQKMGTSSEQQVSGSYLMNQGILPALQGDYDGTAVYLEKVR